MTLTRIIRYSHWNSVIKYDEILSSEHSLFSKGVTRGDLFAMESNTRRSHRSWHRLFWHTPSQQTREILSHQLILKGAHTHIRNLLTWHTPRLNLPRKYDLCSMLSQCSWAYIQSNILIFLFTNTGLLVLYTLKNPTWPEMKLSLKSSPFCL